MTVEVLLAEESFVVINKPPGVSVTFDRHRQHQPSLWRELWGLWGPVYVVHRLDRETTGALLLARTREAQNRLSQGFSQHRVHKVYHAVIAGVPPWRETTIEHPLRPNGDRQHRTVVDWSGGKPARTRVRVLEVLSEGVTLVEASPVTGRHHQVRVHLAAVGFPLVGDGLYGGPKVVSRPLLHARLVAFPHPLTGDPVEVQAPYPRDWSELVTRAAHVSELASLSAPAR